MSKRTSLKAHEVETLREKIISGKTYAELSLWGDSIGVNGNSLRRYYAKIAREVRLAGAYQANPSTVDETVKAIVANILRRAVSVRNDTYRERGYHTPQYWCNSADGNAVAGEELLEAISEIIGEFEFATIWADWPEQREGARS